MEQEEFGREMLRLYYGGECEVTSMEQIGTDSSVP